VEGSVGHRQIVRGIPSVFAQPLYFSNALRSASHPAHAAARAQWRGLLSCFALRDWLQLEIRIEQFSLLRNPESDQRQPEEALSAVLRSQLPELSDDWRDWWLIRCADRLIGATSPWSIVYPPAECETPQSIPWQRDGVLVDPIDHYDERHQRHPSQELGILFAWVAHLSSARATRWGAPSGLAWDGCVTAVADALAAWKRDLEPYRAAGAGEITPSRLAASEPYSQFFQEMTFSNRGSQGRLVSGGGVKKRFVALKRSGLEPRERVVDATVVGDLDLAHMPASADAGWVTRMSRKVDLPYVFVEDVFLPQRLVKIDPAEGVLAARDDGDHYALPLSTRALEYFSIEDLRSGRISLAVVEGKDSVAVDIAFALEDGGSFSARRVYDRMADVIDLGDHASHPAFSLWPDFESPEWRRHIAVYVPQGGAHSPAAITTAPLKADGSTLAASPASYGRRDWIAWRAEAPLVGFVLYVGAIEAGLLLRARPDDLQPVNREKRWQVAVDFGTSNTELMYSEGGEGVPVPLTLQSRTCPLTRAGSGQAEAASLAFFPANGSLNPPFPSVLLHNFGWPAVAEPGSATGELYSPLFRPRPGMDLSKAIPNLKWPKQGAARTASPIRHYLGYLTQAIAAEAHASSVGALELRWSHPQSLPPDARSAMADFWQALPQDLATASLAITAPPELACSESEALGRCFANEPGGPPVRAQGLSIALDVGGGSTDMAFWSAGTLLGQSSFKLAGNDVLGPLASGFPQFLEKMFEICRTDQRERPTRVPSEAELKNLRQRPEVGINALLATAPDRVPRALHGALPAGEPPWSVARTAIYLFFSGVTFYLGLHSRRFIAGRANKPVNILFGGKAAGLLAWLTLDSSVLSRVLGDFYLAGLSYDDPGLSVSAPEFYGPGLRPLARAIAAKAEVAYGLLLPKLDGERREGPATTVVGELGWARPGDTPLAWDSEIDLDGLAKLQPPDNLQSSYATYFASILLPRHQGELHLDRSGLEAVRLTSDEVHHTVATLAKAQGVLQPIFAAELRRMLDLYFERARPS
jgi:hypothetical protein